MSKALPVVTEKRSAGRPPKNRMPIDEKLKSIISVVSYMHFQETVAMNGPEVNRVKKLLFKWFEQLCAEPDVEAQEDIYKQVLWREILGEEYVNKSHYQKSGKYAKSTDGDDASTPEPDEVAPAMLDPEDIMAIRQTPGKKPKTKSALVELPSELPSELPTEAIKEVVDHEISGDIFFKA